MSGLDSTVLQQALTAYQTQINTYVTTQQPTATVGEVLGTKTIVAARRPVLAAGLPYHLVVHGLTVWLLPDHLRHKFRFSLYGSALERLSETPVLTFQQNLPMLAGKKLTLAFAPATSADADLMARFLPQPPADGSSLDPSTLPTSLPGYLLRVVAELRVEGQVVARGGSFTMGQVLVSTAGLYDPGRGWQEVENMPPVAGEYRALAINAAGIAADHVQALHTKLATTKAKLDTNQLLGLTADDPRVTYSYSTVVSYFATNDIAEGLSARAAGVVAYRRPSFGSFTAKVQPHFVFGALGIIIGGFVLLLEAWQLPAGSPERGILANVAYTPIGLGIGVLIAAGPFIAFIMGIVIGVLNYYFASTAKRIYFAQFTIIREQYSFS